MTFDSRPRHHGIKQRNTNLALFHIDEFLRRRYDRLVEEIAAAQAVIDRFVTPEDSRALLQQAKERLHEQAEA
jgi:hypothetical protein